MRITGGRARGIVLKVPRRGSLRPATDFLRQAVFSSLGPLVAQARVLDVFAGTGSYGLEALSRGATHAVWLDADRQTVAAIQANLAAVAKSLGEQNPAALGHACEGDVFTWEPPGPAGFDLVFVDPPYALLPLFGAKLLERAASWSAPGAHARLLLEAPGEFVVAPPAGWVLARHLGEGRRQPSSLIFRRAD
jgi:16S rRNA (guanine966-N2)-methyltransferase